MYQENTNTEPSQGDLSQGTFLFFCTCVLTRFYDRKNTDFQRIQGPLKEMDGIDLNAMDWALCRIVLNFENG